MISLAEGADRLIGYVENVSANGYYTGLGFAAIFYGQGQEFLLGIQGYDLVNIQSGDDILYISDGMVQTMNVTWSGLVRQYYDNIPTCWSPNNDWYTETMKPEFGYQTVEEYLQGARTLTSGGKGIETFTRANGDKLFYNTVTNDFGILSKDGVIRTYFRLGDGIEYWLNQIGR